MKKNFGTALLLSASLSVRLAADDIKSIETTNTVVVSTRLIEQLVTEARTNNPSLRAADSRLRSATANVGALRTWEDPTAIFGGSLYSEKGFKPEEEGNLAYGLEQKLPLWGRPRLNRLVAQADVSLRQTEVEFRFQQLRRDLTRELLMAALAGRVVEIGEQDLVWLDATAQTTEARYRAGQAAIADTLQIQNEVAKRHDLLRTDRRRLGHEHISLNRLLNRKANAAWPRLQLPELVPVIPYSEKLVTLALRSEQKLKVMEQEIKQADAAAQLAHNLRLPDIGLGVEGRQYSGDGDFRSGMFTLHFSLPWGNGGKYRKNFERETERKKAAEEEREDQVLMVREQLHHFTVEIEARRREGLLYRDEIIARTQQALSSRLADWEAGRGTFRDVLDARRMLLESQLMAARAVTEQHQAVAELLLWAGLENAAALSPLTSEPSITPEHDNQEN